MVYAPHPDLTARVGRGARRTIIARAFSDDELCWAEHGTFRDASLGFHTFWASNNPDALSIDDLPLALALQVVETAAVEALAIATFGSERAYALLAVEA